MPIYKKVDKDFFKKWNREVAYVLGFFAADGNIVKTKRNTHFISFYTSDLPLLRKIKKVLDAEHKISSRKDKNNLWYRLQIGSKEIYEDLEIIGMFPNKTKRMKLPRVHNDFICDFIRGYFDGDGNVWSGVINKNRKTKTIVLQISFTSGSNDFLRDLKRLLNSLGMSGGSLYRSKIKNFSRLSFSTMDALKLYEIMYNNPHRLYLNRKKRVFEKFIKMRS